MKFKYSLLFLIFTFTLFPNLLKSQNLVPNPGFEEYNECGYYLIDGNSRGVLFWNTPLSIASGVYYNSCIFIPSPPVFMYTDNSFHHTRTGKAYARLMAFIGVNTYFQWRRSYIQTRLREPLKANCRYQVSFYVKLVGTTGLYGTLGTTAVDGMGAYFSADSIHTGTYDSMFLYRPQIKNPRGNLLKDTLHYTEISGIYTAAGGEEYITIGNFNPDSSTAIRKIVPGNILYAYDSTASYWIDDVSVIAIPPSNLALNIGNDTVVCDTSHLHIPLKAQAGFDKYLWSTGDTTEIISVTQLGKYWVQADFGCGLVADTIVIKTLPKPPTNSIGTDTMICSQSPFTFTITAPAGYKNYLWSTGSKTQSIPISSSGIYSVKADHICWPFLDTMRVSVFNPPSSILEPSDTSICDGQNITFQALSGFQSYLWNNNSTNQAITVSLKSTYKVTATTKENCSVSDSVRLNILKAPSPFYLPEDTTLCEGLELSIDVGSQADYNKTLWNDLSINNNLIVSNAGLYWVKVYNKCFSLSDTGQVNFLDCTPTIPNLITPNNDNKNESFQILTSISRSFYLHIINSWGETVYRSENYQNNWDAYGLSTGLYYYYIQDALLNKQYKGWLQVLK